ncbi:hypothetical protein PLICRDRAFT_47611 [Plicaturopsis crispa FD-325 SS-3]|nr:hypothetical protein PLICRDRAFT_47611 [Plicaturopsis crispa FD-325 SS-3]
MTSNDPSSRSAPGEQDNPAFLRPCSASDGRTNVPPPPPPPPRANTLSQWTRCIHINGSIYYHNKTLRLVTEDNIEKPSVLREVLEFRDGHIRWLEYKGLLSQLPDDFEMLIWGTEEGGHSMKTVSYKKGACFSPGEDGQGIRWSRTSFWDYIETVPMHLEELPPHVETDFLNALTHGASERVFDHKDTTFPFTDQQTERLIQIYRDLKDRQLEAGRDGYLFVPALAWHIARVMDEIERTRQRNGYGTPDARIHRVTVLPEPTWKLRVLDVVLTLVFLGAHRTYRRRLQATRVNGLLHLPGYQQLMRHLLTEWAGKSLIQQTSNIAFLAVPDVDGLQRTASLASSLFAITSIATGVHHVWQHRGRVDVEFEDAHKYMQHVSFFGEELDLAVTACFLSLPIVSLLWSVMSFTIAVGVFCFQASDVRAGIVLAVVLAMSGTGAVCMVVFFWHIWQQRGAGRESDSWKVPLWAQSIVGCVASWRERWPAWRRDGWHRGGKDCETNTDA